MTALVLRDICGQLDHCSEPIDAVDMGGMGEADLMFNCAARLVHGPQLLLPGGRDIDASPGDFALFRSTREGGVRCIYVARSDGRSVAEASGTSVPVATLQKIDALEQQIEQLIAITRQHEKDRAELMNICRALDQRIDTVKLREAA